jgi:demethylmenaquinone methyltransferase/2-methoxy-6-polyprenyl-1,4-benzoquinol methylase
VEKSNKTFSDYTRVKPYNQTEPKTPQLSRMFDTISHQYDKFNDIMSWGFARIWRKKSLRQLAQFQPKKILDVAAGTGDMSINAVKLVGAEKVIGIDISEKMLRIAFEKTKKASLNSKISYEIQDVSNLSYNPNCFDAVTIAFGIRNFEKLKESLEEIHRVLKNNGHLLIVEMNEPEKKWLYKGYQLYTKIFVKFTSKLLSSDKRAYDYLTASMNAFASGKNLIDVLNLYGFETILYKKFTFGVCSMYLMRKKV